MKVVFKVCCVADDKLINSGILSSGTSTTNLSSSATSSSGGASQPPQGVYVNTNIGGTVSSNNGNGLPQIPNVNTNISNVVQSTMSWPGWSHNPPQSTPISSTLSVQSFYPYMTSPRPINSSSVDNNNNFNSNYNSPSHKPTKKSSKCIHYLFFLSTLTKYCFTKMYTGIDAYFYIFVKEYLSIYYNYYQKCSYFTN